VSTEIATMATDNRPMSVYSNQQNFETAQRIAQSLSKSDLVPKQYKDNVANCLIALEIANRVGASPLMVMQNLNIIHNRPSWSSQFIIAALNSCGRFSPLRFRMEGEGDARTCVVIAMDKASGEALEGPPVSISMARSEGWYQKDGSKWKTMPELMLRYRAAAFFGRLYAPDVLMGMQTEDETHDLGVVQMTPIRVEGDGPSRLLGIVQSQKDEQPEIEPPTDENVV